MIRLVLWFSLVLVVAAVAAWLADNPGAVSIEFQSYAIDTSFAALALMIALAGLMAGGGVWLYGWLRRDMPIFGSNQVIKRQSRGFKLLNQSLVALSSGDAGRAKALIEQAEVLLPPQPMVHLIAAEAATRSGDHTAASKRYAALEDTDDGRLLGLRGLLVEARRTGHESEALRLARVAFEENRKSPWVLKTLFALEVAAGNWREAETALEKVAREKLLEAQTVSRHKGALAYAEATELKLKGEKPAARKALKKAISARPDFMPAVVSLSRLELSEGKKSAASKVITDAWSKEPHPSLATAFKEIDTAESTADWLKRVRTLIKTTDTHPQSKLILVDALMDANEYEAARPVLDGLLKESPSRAAWQYKLALAHVLKEDPDPIETALKHASDGAKWRCTNCGHEPKGWSPLCPSCQSFDTLLWSSNESIVTPQQAFEADSTIALLADSGA
ncbi:MAG: hypothetical protein JJ850_05910 [Kordiimonadaceae bacterium]|nr:hypothetical protein [Kordiimonadaceae bacterium]MBO6568141.1 hypothetical protein [Kordiimonadaceae bacterium]MBO6964129.1 hypothetical protein [Kordiimonadaceae bacterium]